MPVVYEDGRVAPNNEQARSLMEGSLEDILSGDDVDNQTRPGLDDDDESIENSASLMDKGASASADKTEKTPHTFVFRNLRRCF